MQLDKFTLAEVVYLKSCLEKDINDILVQQDNYKTPDNSGPNTAPVDMSDHLDFCKTIREKLEMTISRLVK